MVTIKELWQLEKQYSPCAMLGVEKQIIKATEEIGEVCSAYLKNDIPNLKTEIADSINVLMGLAENVYSDPDELSDYLLTAIDKMAFKWSGKK
jgi:NTP pyrophosphatase (non-canonical NTP hydrolase)